jgi:NAD(P)-dependent dehydrogenase (short-subunit alcohol dehydrogenase family)
MILRRQRRIINVVSSTLPLPYLSAYGTSKTALLRLTETIAAEVRGHGISLFAVGPGTTRTAMSEHSLYSEEGRRWVLVQPHFEEKLDVPIESPAQLVVDLATGRLMRCPGGDNDSTGETWLRESSKLAWASL